jgi:hypothetical protein
MSGYDCSAPLHPVAMRNYTCVEVAPAASGLSKTSWPGEPCSEGKLCLYGECRAGICDGASNANICSDSSICNPGLHCVEGTCVPMIAVGSGNCTDEYDCIDSMCHDSICVDYLSLPTGANITATACSGKNSTLHCESGTCNFSKTSDSYQCIEAFQSYYADPHICKSDADCTGLNTQVMMSQSSCTCGYNPAGNAYCDPFMGDLSGRYYRYYWTDFVGAGGIRNCNTLRRYDLDCWISSKGNSYYEDWMNAFYNFHYYPLVQDNDECVKAMFTSDFYPDV